MPKPPPPHGRGEHVYLLFLCSGAGGSLSGSVAKCLGRCIKHGTYHAARPGLFALPGLHDHRVLLDLHAQPVPPDLRVQVVLGKCFSMSWRLVSGCLHMCNLRNILGSLPDYKQCVGVSG